MQIIGILGFAGLMAHAAWSDAKSFRIPNRDPLSIGILFFVVFGFALEPTDLLLHCAAGGLLFLAGSVLFACGVWGGGDAKLLSAAGLWMGFAGMPRFLVVMALSGGVLALTVLALRRVSNCASAGSPWRERLAQTAYVPYGVAIAAAGWDWAAVTLSRPL